MTTHRRTSRARSKASRPRARRAARPRDVELRAVVRLQTASGRAVRDTPIPVAIEPASLFRALA